MATGCGGCGDCGSGVPSGIGAGIGEGTAAGTSSLRATIGPFSRRTAGGIGEGFSRIGLCEIRARWTGLGAVSAGGSTGCPGVAKVLGALASGAGGLGGLATGVSDAGRTSAMVRVFGGGRGRTAMYTIPEAIAAPATKAATIFQFMLNPFTN